MGILKPRPKVPSRAELQERARIRDDAVMMRQAQRDSEAAQTSTSSIWGSLSSVFSPVKRLFESSTQRAAAPRPAWARAPVPYHQRQGPGLRCGEHAVNFILVATGRRTRGTVPLEDTYDALQGGRRRGNFSFNVIGEVLKDHSTTAEHPKPLIMLHINKNDKDKIRQRQLPNRSQAFIV